jgi:hypothetical protein
MKTINAEITGVSPFLMHSDRLANPLDPLKKEISTYTSKRKKTDDDHEEIARLEWLGGMYFDEKIGPYVPGRMLKAALINSAKKTKEGPKIRSGVLVSTDKAKLVYDGPRNTEALWKSGKFTDIRSVVVQRARLMRCRPIFHEWACRFEIVYDESVIDKSDIFRLLGTAGTMIGIGDFRPENGGDFGRFDAKEV